MQVRGRRSFSLLAPILAVAIPLTTSEGLVREDMYEGFDQESEGAWVEIIREVEGGADEDRSAQPSTPSDDARPADERLAEDSAPPPPAPDTLAPDAPGSGGNGGSGGGSQDPVPSVDSQPAVQEENLCVDGEVVDGECVELSQRICGLPGAISMPTVEDPSGGLNFAPTFCPDEEEEEEEAPEEPTVDEPEGQDAEPAVTEVEEDAPPPPPTITMADFLELPFEPSVVSFEPDLLGFGYLNRHVNVFAEVDTQVISQEMLGFEVDIRALPAQFHWDYGDGTTRSTHEPGAPLPDYDSAGFEVNKTDTETLTSHTYSETGRFPVTVDTVFLGEYRIDGGPWISIPGSARITSEPGESDIWRISARNVSGPCEDTESWGCKRPVELEEGDSPPLIFQDQYDDHGNWIGPQG